MRKLILAAAALAFVSSTVSAQTPDKAGGTTGPAAQSDTMSKGEATKMAPKKAKKSAKKSAKKTGESATKQ